MLVLTKNQKGGPRATYTLLEEKDRTSFQLVPSHAQEGR